MIRDFINSFPVIKIRNPLSTNLQMRSNLIRSAAGSEFKDILSAFRTQPAQNTIKTKALTIVDYQARPVISKSRFRSRLEPAAVELKNAVTNQLPKPPISAATEKETLKTRLLCARENKALDLIEKPQVTTSPQSADLTEQQIIEQKVQKAAEKYNLPPALITAVIRAESNFDAQAVSSAGAQGLMQLMPATAEELGVKDPFDIEQNIEGGTKYLRQMLDRFEGSLRKALAAYNAGPGIVKKYGDRVPYPETRRYVQRVLRFSRQTA